MFQYKLFRILESIRRDLCTMIATKQLSTKKLNIYNKFVNEVHQNINIHKEFFNQLLLDFINFNVTDFSITIVMNKLLELIDKEKFDSLVTKNWNIVDFPTTSATQKLLKLKQHVKFINDCKNYSQNSTDNELLNYVNNLQTGPFAYNVLQINHTNGYSIKNPIVVMINTLL